MVRAASPTAVSEVALAPTVLVSTAAPEPTKSANDLAAPESKQAANVPVASRAPEPALSTASAAAGTSTTPAAVPPCPEPAMAAASDSTDGSSGTAVENDAAKVEKTDTTEAGLTASITPTAAAKTAVVAVEPTAAAAPVAAPAAAVPMASAASITAAPATAATKAAQPVTAVAAETAAAAPLGTQPDRASSSGTGDRKRGISLLPKIGDSLPVQWKDESVRKSMLLLLLLPAGVGLRVHLVERGIFAALRKQVWDYHGPVLAMPCVETKVVVDAGLRRPGGADTGTVIQTREKSGHPMEFYVHYKDFDRRLDEWVTVDRLDLKKFEEVLTGASDQPKMKWGRYGPIPVPERKVRCVA